MTVNAIRDINSLRGNMIRAGQTLMLPKPAETVVASNRSTSRDQTTYTVKPGDSLYSIARRFNIQIDNIRSWNTLGRHLQPGEQLTLYLP